jgi:hypothetical protein
MENLLTELSYYWDGNGTLQKALLVFWAFAVISFYGAVIYGVSTSLFNYLKFKLNAKFN